MTLGEYIQVCKLMNIDKCKCSTTNCTGGELNQRISRVPYLSDNLNHEKPGIGLLLTQN